MSLPSYERETTITYNDAEDFASVYTCNRVLMRKLDRFCGEDPLVSVICEDETSRVYHMPKQYVSFRLPPLVSEDTRTRRADMARQLNRNKAECPIPPVQRTGGTEPRNVAGHTSY